MNVIPVSLVLIRKKWDEHSHRCRVRWASGGVDGVKDRRWLSGWECRRGELAAAGARAPSVTPRDRMRWRDDGH